MELSGSEDDETKLVRCEVCTCTYFLRPFSDEELSCLYSGYRDTEYFAVRKRWEPWYRQSVNQAFEDDSPELRERIDFMERIIDASGRRNFSIAVDYGGDGGQFFPKQCTGSKTIIDVSNKPLADGVSRVRELSELAEKPDFVLVCHLLEHLNEPAQLLSEVREILGSDGCVYVEVPQDLPIVRKWHASRQYRNFVQFTRKHRFTTIGSDFLAGVCRQFDRSLPRLGLVKQSEHINYFSEKALTLLLERSGFEILAVESDQSAGAGSFRLGKLGIMATTRSN
jgi:hypothetical protein